MSLVTPVALLSYPYLFEPQKPRDEGQDPKYSATLVFLDEDDIAPLKRAVIEVLVSQHGKDKATEMIKNGSFKLIGGPHHSIRTDVGGKGYPEEAVAMINARTGEKYPPGVFSTVPDPETGKPMPITDQNQIYPGIKVKALVDPYWYDVGTNKGVAWGLNGIQKISDGERLDGRVKAENVFEADENAVADLGDLTNPVDSEPESQDDEGDLDIDELLG